MDTDILVIGSGGLDEDPFLPLRERHDCVFIENDGTVEGKPLEVFSYYLNEYRPKVLIVEVKGESRVLRAVDSVKNFSCDTDIVAAVSSHDIDAGVECLKKGVSDFMVLPADESTVELYVDRAMKRVAFKNHICNETHCFQLKYKKSEEKYQQLFNEVPCFIYVQDSEYRITDSNRKFNEYFGRHIGEYCFGICKNRDEPCRKCPVQDTFRDGKNHTTETEIISSDGVKHTVLSWTAPIRDNLGEIVKVIVMLTDITEVRRLEDHLASLGFMIGSISHGIKGLLTSLDSGMYLVNKGFESGDRKQTKEGLEIANLMTGRIKRLVLDILYYTKSRELNFSRIPVKGFLDETVGMVQPKAESMNVAVNVNVELENGNGEDWIEVDRSSFQAAIMNILENAVEAFGEDTDGRSGENRSVWFNARVDDEKAVFLIQDNGPGMDEQTLNNIFAIFFSSKGNRGTGLGLYITSKVIHQHQGEIKAKSTLGKGSKFLIKIPRSVPETARNRQV